MFLKANSGFKLNATIDPEEVGQELIKLGRFTPDDIVSVASSPESPLHKYFEWDDSKAAKAYRLEQARALVVSVHIEEGVRAFESVVIDSAHVYVPHSDLMRNKDLIDQVIESALKELLYWRAKNEKYKNHFGSVFHSIDEAEIKIRSKHGQENKGHRGKVSRDKTRHSANKKGDRENNHSRRLAASR